MKRKPKIALLFEPRDLWIGLYWRYDPPWKYNARTDFYLCLIPCFPIKLSLPAPEDSPFDITIRSKLSPLRTVIVNAVAMFCPVREQSISYQHLPVLTFREKHIAKHFAWVLSAWGIEVSEPEMSMPF